MADNISPNDPIDAQREARRLLAKKGYILGLGDKSAGLPPSAGSEDFLTPRTGSRIGGREVNENRFSGDDLSGTRGELTGSALSDMIRKSRMAAEESSFIPSSHRHADGAVVSPEPSKYSKLFDFLFGRKALDAASKVGDQPSQTMPQNQTAPQDNSAVREAARQAAERMQKAKDANKGQTPEAFCGGGMVRPGNYGR